MQLYPIFSQVILKISLINFIADQRFLKPHTKTQLRTFWTHNKLFSIINNGIMIKKKRA